MADDIKARFLVHEEAKSEGRRLRDQYRPNPKVDDVKAAVERVVRELWNEGYDRAVYEPFGLTRKLVVERSDDLAPLPDDYITKILDRGESFFDKGEFGLELALCGFDDRGRSAVLSVDGYGDVGRHFDTGFVTIGEGDDAANARKPLAISRGSHSTRSCSWPSTRRSVPNV